VALQQVPDLPVPSRVRAKEACCQLAKLENCQRTIVFLLLSRLKSTKISLLYLPCFQSSPARPQATATILCSRYLRPMQASISASILARFIERKRSLTRN
jgi:hypothetical protein